MMGIRQARSKPLHIVAPVDVEENVNVVKFELPPAKGKVKLIDPNNVEELVRLLHEEAKVI